MRLDEGWGATRAVIPTLGRAGLGWCEPAGLCPWRLAALQQQGGPGHLEQVLAPDSLPTPLQSVVTHARGVQNVAEFVPENLQYTNPIYQHTPNLIIES